ncbi:SIMPL domain-containing protein [Spirochaetes bacterium]|uniref:SIMPL domain-containing protein n=1 Tax=Candidatus Scatousia excrementipullorum TaxID=2840936 RepID=A0A9D9DRE2_9BACT|nr:SIMPL domain-containing protein [Candidatus Scatousia excrementipullorum]
MKKLLLAVAVLGLAAGLAATSVNAAEDTRGYVTVATSANTEVSPDVVEINISVKTKDSKSLQKATAENKEISDKVYNAIKGMIDTTKGDYVKTSDFNATPVYRYTNSKQIFDRYEVSNSVIVKTKNIAQAGDIIDKAISLGATNVNDLVFSISNYDNQCNDLIAVAAKKARTRGDIMAKSAGSYITGIKSMNASCSTSQNRPVQYRLMAKNVALSAGSADAAAPEMSSTPIQGGIIKIYANLNTSFFVK